VKQAYKAQAE